MYDYADVHNSDTEAISIPFTVDTEGFGYDPVSDLTSPGLELGVGQQVNIDGNTDNVQIEFELTNGQYIDLSEVIGAQPCARLEGFCPSKE